jgi:predicted HicB family RNase H-like nuclease
MTETIDFENDAEAMAKARAKWQAKGKSKGSEVKERKAREKQIRSAVDGRSLKVTGRTVQFNFRCREEIRAGVADAAKAEGIKIAEWLERAIEAALGAGGN